MSVQSVGDQKENKHMTPRIECTQGRFGLTRPLKSSNKFLFQADLKPSKRRQPFVPYALRNHTGCTIWFAPLTTTPTR